MKFFPYILLLAFALGSCTEKLTPQWERIANPATNKLQVITSAGDSLLWIAGGLRYGEESLMQSADGASHWQIEPEIFGQSWFDAHFLDSRTGFLCGISGKCARTLDGGQSWQLRQLDGWLPMRSISAKEGVVLAVGGVAYDVGIIARSVDQGNSWRIIDSLEVELRDVLFVDDQTVFACGFGTILKSTDAGLQWELLPAEGEFFTAMAFPTASTGFAVGRSGSILRTKDGGSNWETLRKGDALGKVRQFYNEVVFWDEETGYIVGDKGLVLHTGDGGASWQKLENDSKDDLFGIRLSGASEGWVVGENGCLLHFSL